MHGAQNVTELRSRRHLQTGDGAEKTLCATNACPSTVAKETHNTKYQRMSHILQRLCGKHDTHTARRSTAVTPTRPPTAALVAGDTSAEPPAPCLPAPLCPSTRRTGRETHNSQYQRGSQFHSNLCGGNTYERPPSEVSESEESQIRRLGLELTPICRCGTSCANLATGTCGSFPRVAAFQLS